MSNIQDINARLASARIYSWDEIEGAVARARDRCPNTLFWMVRHSETVCNAEDKISGQLETLLTPKGKTKAADLRRQLPADLRIVFTSALKRSVQTMSLALPPGRDYVFHPAAETLQRYLDVVEDHFLTIDHDGGLPRCDVFVDARLNEVSFGELEGKSRSLLGRYRQDDIDLTPPGGETYRVFARRVLSGLCDALDVAGADDNTLLCFAHSGTMRVVRSLTPEFAARDALFRAKPPSGEFAKYAVGEFKLPSYWRS